MTKQHSDDAINAAIFAADQAREALCFLLHSSIASQHERALFLQCFEKLQEVQERAGGEPVLQAPRDRFQANRRCIVGPEFEHPTETSRSLHQA